MADMDVGSIGSSRVTAPPQPSASDDGTPPSLGAFQRVAWFDLNGDGKIDNVPTMYGGDAYMNPTGDSIDEQLADRIAIKAPQHGHVATSHGVNVHQLARARAAYAAHSTSHATH
jgi:hypothetical protein